MGISCSKTVRAVSQIKQTNELTENDVFAIFLYIKTASSGINYFEDQEDKNLYKYMSKNDLINSIRSIIYDPFEISKISQPRPQFQTRLPFQSPRPKPIQTPFLNHSDAYDHTFDLPSYEECERHLPNLKLPELVIIQDQVSPRVITIQERSTNHQSSDLSKI